MSPYSTTLFWFFMMMMAWCIAIETHIRFSLECAIVCTVMCFVAYIRAERGR